MFFRGVQFQRDGHARYNLLLTHTLLSNSANLAPVGILVLTEIPHCVGAGIITQERHRQEPHRCRDHCPFDTTQAIFLGTGPVMPLCHRPQFASSLSPHFERSHRGAPVVDQTPTRVKVQHTTAGSDRHPIVRTRTERTRAFRASE